ncbi:hypothetical protein Rs2_10327 [Raphanus sativus]|nr:hypothetical protein Rs2_10327 [Raphanus sativus]
MNKVLQFGLHSSKFLAVPLRSSRFGSSMVSVRVGTKSFNKRLMSNAATPLSINNTKGKEMKVAAAAATDHNSHQMVDESSGAEIKETTSSTRSESVTIKRKIRNREESTDDDDCNSSQAYGEKRVKQSSEKNFKAKVSSKAILSEHKSLTKTGKKKSRLKEEEASLTISSKVLKVDEIISSSVQSEPWTVLAHTKPEEDWKAYNPKTMRPPPLPDSTKSMKIMTWNVNGLRALLKLESFSALQLAQRENFDVLCLQETKI